MDQIEQEAQLSRLREAAIWQLNAAIGAGWDDAADAISATFAEDEKALRRRWRSSAAA